MSFSPVPDGEVVRLVLPAEDGSVREVRHAVEETLRKWDVGVLIDDAVLVASELATNAIGAVAREQEQRRSGYAVTVFPAGGLCIHVLLYTSRNERFIAVWDTTDAAPVIVTEAGKGESGRGPFLVNALTRRWGYVPAPQGASTSGPAWSR